MAVARRVSGANASSGGGSGAVTSVAGRTGDVTLAESDVASLVSDLALKAPLASPTFTGTPSLPTGTTGTTQSAADGSTKLATTAYVDTADALKANLASPTFTGTPAAPTAAVGTNTTQLATMAALLAALPNGATAGQMLVWNGSAWIAATPPTNSGIVLNSILAESLPLESASQATVAVSGTKYVIRVPLTYSTTFTNVLVNVSTAGSSPTSSQNFVAVYNSSGTQIGSTSADQSTPWTSAGLKTIAVGTPGAQTGSVYVEILTNMGTTPAFARGPGPTLLNANLTGANLRAATNGTTATAVDASITPASLVSTSAPLTIWVGLS